MMKLRSVSSIATGAAALLAAGLAFAQANPQNSGYVLFGYGDAKANVWRSGSYGGKPGVNDTLCWRTGYWTPAMAIRECDPDLVKVAAAPAAPPPPPPPPAVAPTPPAPTPPAPPAPPAPPKPAAPTPPAAAPAPPPPAAQPPAPPAPPPAPRAPAAPTVQKITLSSKALFDFDKAVLRPDGKAALDREVVERLKGVQRLELVLVTGHTDRIGSQAYNQRLSERRAAAVRDYLVSRGVPKDKIETLGMGKTQPVPGVVCNQKNFRELVKCLQPHRRVEVEVKGEAAPR